MNYNEKLLALTHTGEEPEHHLYAAAPPVFLNSLHMYDTFEAYASVDDLQGTQFVYGRGANPTTLLLEKKLAALEGGTRCAAFASGMAAATAAIFATCEAGDHIILMRDTYRPIRQFMAGVGMPRLKFEVSYVSGLDIGEIEQAIRPNTRLMMLESPATFVFTVVDIQAITALCRRYGIKSYIDNTYSTPLHQNPLEMGVDIVMHTLSKYLGGHSDIIGGALIAKDDALMTYIIKNTREWFGGILGPMEAWLVIRGIRTLDARLSKHQENAMAVANFLQGHKKVRKVYYTGLPSHPQAALIEKQMRGHAGLMSFVLDCAPESAVGMIDRLRLFGKGCSWGGYESLALCPLYHADAAELAFLGMEDERGLVRIHCGLEGVDNLIDDLAKALEAM